MPSTLAYWNIRGLAQYIKFLLEYTGEEYVEKIYKFGPAPDYDSSQWFKEKFTHGLDFPNLPYYIDGDIKLTQSVAILKHVARKHNLLGDSKEEVARAEMLEYEAMDMLMIFGNITYSPNFISYVDFILYEAFYGFYLLSPSSFDKYENLKKFMERLEGLEPIKKYIESDRYIKYPIVSPTAYFGGK
ncbi:Glutathione S-transferase class-mu 26 kDa isozyme [Armadillidium vulgare]|nr:Glutathione S-transferase class-mu 26 kDa isozyme [Armadillidium vulgare]